MHISHNFVFSYNVFIFKTEKFADKPFPAAENKIKGIENIVEEEFSKYINELSKDIVHKAQDRINIQEIVENKINELDLYELENIILSIAEKELKHIEVLGLILGFLIGIVQGILTIFI